MKRMEIIEENGIKYQVETYDDGTKVKSVYSETPSTPPEPTPQTLLEISETDEAILNTSANVEYLVALKELEV